MFTYDKDSSLQFYLKFGHLKIINQYLKIQNLTIYDTRINIHIQPLHSSPKTHRFKGGKLAMILKNENSFVNNQIDLGPNCSYLKHLL
jgi:hypothetical protein